MVTLLRPLDLSLAFEGRPYELGETVAITVELRPQSDVVIREGRIDLVCQERYEVFYRISRPTKERRHIFKPGMMRALRSDNPGPRQGAVFVPSYFQTDEVTKSRGGSYVHSSVRFLSNERLGSGTANSYCARLQIGPEPPQHTLDPAAKRGTVSWTLVARVDVARARDVTERRRIDLRDSRPREAPTGA